MLRSAIEPLYQRPILGLLNQHPYPSLLGQIVSHLYNSCYASSHNEVGLYTITVEFELDSNTSGPLIYLID